MYVSGFGVVLILVLALMVVVSWGGVCYGLWSWAELSINSFISARCLFKYALRILLFDESTILMLAINALMITIVLK